MNDVVTSLDYMKNDLGDVYMPSQDINTIENWNERNGYQVNMLNAENLEFMGTFINPLFCGISLEALKWYIVSYLPDNSIPVQDALYSIRQHLILCKDYEGKVFYPKYGINKIGDMKVGQGYKLCTQEDITLVYPYLESNFSNLVSGNLLQNPNFEDWGSSNNAPPNYWNYSHYYGGEYINRENVIVQNGTYSVRINSSSTYSQTEFYQVVSNYNNYPGMDFEFGCWIKGSKNSTHYIQVSDGVNTFPVNADNTYSGSGEWEYLKVRGRIAGNPTTLRVSVYTNVATTVYIDNAHLYCWDISRTMKTNYVEQEKDFIYNSLSSDKSKAKQNITQSSNMPSPEPRTYVVQHTLTGSDVTLLVNSDEFDESDEIGVFTYNGKLVGSGVVEDNKSVITIWGDNRRTPKFAEGASDNEELIVKLWSKQEKKEYQLKILKLKDLLTNADIENTIIFRSDKVLQAEVSKGISSINNYINDLELTITNYPNPANKYTTFRYEIPEQGYTTLTIYNALGQKISDVVSQWKDSGKYTTDYNTSLLNSGVYYYQLKVGSKYYINKMIIVE